MQPAWLKSIHHDGSQLFVSNLYPRLGETVHLRLRTGASTPIKTIYLRTFPDGEQFLAPLIPTTGTAVDQWWEIDLHINQPHVHYRFLINADDGLWTYSAAGCSTAIPTDHTDFQIVANYEPTRWLETAVFYQIFPDRFANGDPTQNPGSEEFTFNNHKPQTFQWNTPPAAEQPFPLVFFGGDLAGIIQKLDYLKHLGINALYLNPIFTARSNHKYDVVDYEHVDPHFGGDAALIALREALDARNMRYILDIVPNHCGYYHPWFQAALADANAPEADFFTFTKHPDDYESWLGLWTLPKLNYRSSELRRRIYAGSNSIFRKWLTAPFAADGWRVDVANMLARQGETQMGTEISREIRQAVKSTRPDAYLMGENFFDASPQLQGDQYDGVMNYTGFTQPLWYWLTGYKEWAHSLKMHVQSTKKWPTQALIDTWQSRRAAIPWAIVLQQYNLLDSHDTPRIRSIVAGKDALHRLAVTVQFTFPGVPGIYYGDEIGMLDDPILAARGCMRWDEAAWDYDLLTFYRRLIALRQSAKTLQKGGFQILAVEEDTFVYQRMDPNGRFLIIAHRGEENRQKRPLTVSHGGIADGTLFAEYFSGQKLVVHNGELPLDQHPQGATLWQQI